MPETGNYERVEFKVPEALPVDDLLAEILFVVYVGRDPALNGGYSYSRYSFLYWLIENGYLDFEDDGYSLTRLIVTPKGTGAGLYKVLAPDYKTGELRSHFAYDKNMQQLLLDKLVEIRVNDPAYKEKHKKRRVSVRNNQNRAYKERIQTNKGSEWTEEEISYLREQDINEHTIFVIAGKLKRSPTAVAMKAVAEGIVDKDELHIKGVTDTDMWRQKMS